MTLIHGHLPQVERPAVARSPRLRVEAETDPGWRDEAACRAEDPELFFPVSELFRFQIDTAKRVCDRCPVIDTCLSWALETAQQDGIWGGKTTKERVNLRRSLGRKSRAEVA